MEKTYEEQRNISNMECQNRVSDIVLNLMDELNRMGNEEEVEKFFIAQLKCTHRTLQQNFFRHIIVPCIKDFAQRFDEGNYDDRNEKSCYYAKQMMPIIKDAGLPFI